MQHNKNPNYNYVLNGLRLCKTDQDLGVLTTDFLLWSDQMKASIRKLFEI